MNNPTININKLLEEIIEIKSVCSMAVKQANSMINELGKLLQQTNENAQKEKMQSVPAPVPAVEQPTDSVQTEVRDQVDEGKPEEQA